MINSFKLPNGILESGVRLGDKVQIDAFQKNRRDFSINRTKYTLVDGPDFVIDFQRCEIQLPTFNYEKIHCELALVHGNSDSEGRFLINSLSENPVRINGNWVRSAYIERGDTLEIGMNKFYFQNAQKEESNINIPDEIIKSNIAILIEGETGTGKTYLAKKIHEDSNLAGNFVHLNLASFSSSLLESELFGHVKGAFTGSVGDKKGAILEAHKGTLFLDEIDSVSLDLQTKLLLFLESQEFRQVGGDRVLKAQTRIIFASGKSLFQLVANNQMRKDFYFRLMSGFSYRLKSLREQPEKILCICREFEKEEYVILSDELIKYYQSLSWPGNIRQLRAQLKKKKVLSGGKKLIYDVHDHYLLDEAFSTDGFSQKVLTLEEVKINHCAKVFNCYAQNYKAASTALDISQNTLRSLLGKLNWNLAS